MTVPVHVVTVFTRFDLQPRLQGRSIANIGSAMQAGRSMAHCVSGRKCFPAPGHPACLPSNSAPQPPASQASPRSQSDVSNCSQALQLQQQCMRNPGPPTMQPQGSWARNMHSKQAQACRWATLMPLSWPVQAV